MAERVLAEHFAPGEYLAEMLRDRGLMPAIPGLTMARVHGIIYHDEVFTEDEARVIAAYMGTSAELWLGLQAAHFEASRD